MFYIFLINLDGEANREEMEGLVNALFMNYLDAIYYHLPDEMKIECFDTLFQYADNATEHEILAFFEQEQ